MTHVEHLLALIEEGEALRDQMRREMEVMADIIERQNATAIKQGALLVKAEAAVDDYKQRIQCLQGRAVLTKRKIKHLENTVADLTRRRKLTSAYIMQVNGGAWPADLVLED